MCHDESWYQLKHGLQVWAISPPSPLIKVCLTSPPSPRDKKFRRLKQRTEEMALRQLKSEERASLLQEDHLNWPNNQITVKRKTVAHIINPGKITRFVHATDLAWHVPFSPFRGFFVGDTNLELQRQLSQYSHVLFTQPSSRTFWLMALSVNPVNPMQTKHGS